MLKKRRFLYIAVSRNWFAPIAVFAAIMQSGCSHNPPVISCPVPPSEFMAAPEPLPKLEGGSARDVFTALAEDNRVYSVTAERLRGLQDWGRNWCGWGPVSQPPP